MPFLPRIILLSLLLGVTSNLQAAARPDLRPAVFAPGPRSLINLINGEGLMKRGQKDGLVMFDLVVTRLARPHSHTRIAAQPALTSWPTKFLDKCVVLNGYLP